MRSSLSQGGLEIKCIVTVNWASDDGVDILMSSIEKNYSFEDRLVDDSKTVLPSLRNLHEIENVEDDVDLIVINQIVSLFLSCFH